MRKIAVKPFLVMLSLLTLEQTCNSLNMLFLLSCGFLEGFSLGSSGFTATN